MSDARLHIPVHTHTYSNGLTLLVHPMPAVHSAAFNFLLPGGASLDAVGAGGCANVLVEWVTRGAGGRSNRELSDHLDGLGLERGQAADRELAVLDGALLGPQLEAALAAYADIILRPQFDATDFEQTRETALQQIEAQEDQPAAKWSRELWRRWWPFPYSRPLEGTREELEALTPEAAAADFADIYRPAGTILAIAGAVEWPRIREFVGDLFDGWTGAPRKPMSGLDTRARVSQIVEPIEQTHLGVVCESVPFGHPDYIKMAIAMQVLSGGMGARLFSEVREKRGLCYSVGASLGRLKGRAALVGYANPEPPKAQETLEVLLGELRRLRDGVTAEELARAKTGVKSRLVMSAESTRARAGGIAADWFHLGRVRSIPEIRTEVDAVTLDSLNGYLAAHPPVKFSMVTLGPAELTVPNLD